MTSFDGSVFNGAIDFLYTQPELELRNLTAKQVVFSQKHLKKLILIDCNIETAIITPESGIEHFEFNNYNSPTCVDIVFGKVVDIVFMCVNANGVYVIDERPRPLAEPEQYAINNLIAYYSKVYLPGVNKFVYLDTCSANYCSPRRESDDNVDDPDPTSAVAAPAGVIRFTDAAKVHMLCDRRAHRNLAVSFDVETGKEYGWVHGIAHKVRDEVVNSYEWQVELFRLIGLAPEITDILTDL